MLSTNYCNNINFSKNNILDWYVRFKEENRQMNANQVFGIPVKIINDKKRKKGKGNKKIKTDKTIQNEECNLEDFSKIKPTKLLEMEFGLPKSIIRGILIEKLGLEDANVKLFSEKLTTEQKLVRLEHCKQIINEARNDKEFLRKILIQNEMIDEPDTKSDTENISAQPPDENNKEKELIKLTKIQIMSIYFHDLKGILHTEFVSNDIILTDQYYVDVLIRLVEKICFFRPECREPGGLQKLRERATAYIETPDTDFFMQYQKFWDQHPAYVKRPPASDEVKFIMLPERKPVNQELLSKIEEHYRHTNNSINDFSVKDIQNLFEDLIKRANSSISTEGERQAEKIFFVKIY